MKVILILLLRNIPHQKIDFLVLLSMMKYWSTMNLFSNTLGKKCLYSELFCSTFSRIWAEHGEIRSISPYSVRMRENVEQNNSEYGHFLGSESQTSWSCWRSSFTRYNLNDSVMNKKQEDQIKFYPENILLKKENGFAVVSYICYLLSLIDR